MRIVLVSNEFIYGKHGGIATFTHLYARSLVKAGHSVDLIYTGRRLRVSNLEGINVYELPSRRLFGAGRRLIRRAVSLFTELVAHIRQVDIVECPDYYGLLPYPVRSFPLVVRLHLSLTIIDNLAQRVAPKAIAWYEERTLHNADAWIGVSRHIVDLTRGYFPGSYKEAFVAHNFSPSQNLDMESDFRDRYRVLFVGSVSERKGAIVLTKAMSQVFARYPHASLTFVGETQSSGEACPCRLLALLPETERKRVEFLGFRPQNEIRDLMLRCGVFAFPSRLEAMPMVLLEAMACKIPIVYSRSPPGSELIINGVTGLLVDERCPSDVAEGVMKYLGDPIFARNVANRSLERAGLAFSASNCIKRSLEAYAFAIDNFKCKGTPMHSHYSQILN